MTLLQRSSFRAGAKKDLNHTTERFRGRFQQRKRVYMGKQKT